MITTRTIFDRQLCSLDVHVQEMAQMVSHSLTQSMQALQAHDLTIAREIDVYDSQINERRFAIEEEAYRLLALQQPVSVDMRRIVATVSVVTNLERMGDHAAGNARLAIRMGEGQRAEVCPEFAQMTLLLQSMLDDSIKAFIDRDLTLARSVIKRDADIDRLHKQAYERLIAVMTSDPSQVESGTQLLWISHNLERIGDRCATICERVNYLVTGDLMTRADPMP
jgi:phosphate transport system protein